MKRRLVVVGAGDFARELLWACSDLPLEQREWQDICFVDDNLEGARERLQRYQLSFPVIATTCEFSPSEDDVLICAIGDPRSKLNACERLQARGGSFTNVIHPSVAVGPGAMLGNGVIVTRFSGVGVDVHIGNFVTINSYSGCGHDAVLEDGCTVSAHCDITGHAHLERGVFLGSHAAVMPGVRVGAFATVAAGSVAFRNVKAGETVIGVPAKAIF
jgi:sugar O-acyltransferase (sialic acid O-acetyltransferase NeuD family)